MSIGDLRAMRLVFLAGAHEHLSGDDLLWALQNAGGDRMGVIRGLAKYLVLIDAKLSRSLKYQIVETMAKLEGEAKIRGDEEELSFLKEVKRICRIWRLLLV